jgi:hypothetical protein
LDLVSHVIDHVADRELHRYYLNASGEVRYNSPHKALSRCSLVSKSWTHSSRVHMFKKVRIWGSRDKPPPPTSILPYIKKLNVFYDGLDPVEATNLAGLLKTFTASPIESLVITRATLTDKQPLVLEFIDMHFTTLRKIEFVRCLLSPHNISETVMGRHRLRSLQLVRCERGQFLPPEQPLITDNPTPGSCPMPSELELYIYGGPECEGSPYFAAVVAELPCRFSKLHVEHMSGDDGVREATNSLIKANGDALSSLSVDLSPGMFKTLTRAKLLTSVQPGSLRSVDVGPEHLFSLEDCSNLFELTLSVALSGLHQVRFATIILSTLGLARSSHLERIILRMGYVDYLFDRDGLAYAGDEEGNDEDDGGEGSEKARVNWMGLDEVLSELAKSSIKVTGKPLTFTLVSTWWRGNEKRMHGVKKWLPRMLPRFRELGLLHVHCKELSDCR